MRKDTETKGKINHAGTVQVAGDIAAESILIENTASVLANIAAEEVLCKGKYVAISAPLKKLKITKEAEVTGDIHTPNLNIEKGALF